MNRYRYKKTTPSDIEEMKRLREKGMYYWQIGDSFNMNASSVQYYLSPGQKEKNKARAQKHYKTLSKEQIKEKNKKRAVYTKNYIKERYHRDPTFRKYYLNLVQGNFQKRRDKWIEEGLCSHCGAERENKDFKFCIKCRKYSASNYRKPENIKKRKEYDKKRYLEKKNNQTIKTEEPKKTRHINEFGRIIWRVPD